MYILTILLILRSGLLIFRAVSEPRIQVNPRNPAKFTKTRKIPPNSAEILSNTCLYNIFETYFSYRGYLLGVNLQIYLGTSSLKRTNNVPKLPGVDYVTKNWALGEKKISKDLGSLTLSRTASDDRYHRTGLAIWYFYKLFRVKIINYTL